MNEYEIPDYLDLSGAETPPEDLPAGTPEERAEIVRAWLNEFEGQTPESVDVVVSNFLNNTPGRFGQRDERRERADELRQASYYRACRDMQWLVEHSAEELAEIVRKTWPFGLSQAEALFADAAYVEAKEHIARRKGGAA